MANWLTEVRDYCPAHLQSKLDGIKPTDSLKWRWLLSIQHDNYQRVTKSDIDAGLKSQVLSAIDGVIRVLIDAVCTGIWDATAAWAASSAESAERAAWSAAWAAWSAAWAARSAESAAWAANSVAWSAAWAASSAESAERAAWSAAWAASSAESAERAAWSAAWAASSAAWAARSAESAERAAWSEMIDALVSMQGDPLTCDREEYQAWQLALADADAKDYRRLIFADWLEERGHTVVANWYRYRAAGRPKGKQFTGVIE